MSYGDPMLSHRRQAQIENARFLLDTARIHPSAVARRLGMSEDALEKMLERSKHVQRDSHQVPGRSET